MSMEIEKCQYCGAVGKHSPDCPIQFKVEENKETTEKSKNESWVQMEEFIKKLGAESHFSREVEENEVILTAESGEKYKIEHVKNQGEKENLRLAKEIREFLSGFFEEDENVPVDDNAKAIGVSLSNFFIVREAKGEIISFMDSQLVDLELRDGGQGKESSLLVWYVVTKEEYRGKGLAAELYRAAYETVLVQAREKDVGLSAIIGETHPDVEAYLNKLGRKRMYYEKQDGSFAEVPYKAMPSNVDSEAMPEHFMARFLDGRERVSKDEYLRQIKGIYDQYTRSEYFDDVPEDFIRKYFALVKKTYDEIEKKLTQSKGGIIYLLSMNEREAKKKELSRKKKRLVEMKV